MHLVIYKLCASFQLTKYQFGLITAGLSRRDRAWVLRSLLQTELEHVGHSDTCTDTQFALGLN